MNHWPKITLTGIDRFTYLESVGELIDMDPRVEVAVLYSETPEGRNRYPSLEQAIGIGGYISRQFAVHICGRKAREHLMKYKLAALTLHANRLQINGAIAAAEVRELCAIHRLRTIITQDNNHNRFFREAQTAPNHALLVDHSGGRGISPEEWRRPETPKPVGFAGGLGPHNLREQLPKIAAVATGHWWIDMETGLRDEQDRFDPDRAKRAVAIFLDFLEHHPSHTKEI